MSGLYRSSVSAAPLTVRNGGEEASTEGEQAIEKKVEMVELADGVRIAIRRGLSAAEEEQLRQKQQKPAVRIEKVVNAWGSAAGAGSDFFDCYRRTRNVEMRRLEKMDEEFRKKLETEEFQLQRHQRMEETLKKNAAARERRRRRKMKQQEQQRAVRLDNKKSTSSSAAHGVTDVNSTAGSGSASGNGDSDGVDVDAYGSTASGEPQAGQAARRTRAENRISSASDDSGVSDGEARVRNTLGRKRRRRCKEEPGGTEEEEAEPNSSEESEGAESEEDKNKEQNPKQRKRRRAEGEEGHSSSTGYTHYRRSQSHEQPGGGQLGGSAERAVHVKFEKEKEKEEDEHAPVTVMKEGMITVHDGDW